MSTVYQPTSIDTSPEIGQLTEALAKASAEFGEILKGAENPYYGSRYADLSTLIAATRPALSKNGLAILQFPTVNRDENSVTTTTILAHASNQRIVTQLTLPAVKGDAQGVGSAITYGRRYSYSAILNIAGEDDDDGNAAVGKTQEDRKSKVSDTGQEIINPVQMRAFVSACKTGGKTDQQVNDWLRLIGIEEPSQLSKLDFPQAIKWALNKSWDSTKEQIDKSIEAVKSRKGKKPNSGQPIVGAMDHVDKDEIGAD
jgi:ERF superfamily